MKIPHLTLALLTFGLAAGALAVAQEGAPVAAKQISLRMRVWGWYCPEFESFFGAIEAGWKSCPIPRGARLQFYLHVGSEHQFNRFEALSREQSMHFRETGELPAGYPIVIFTRQWIESISCALLSDKGVRIPLAWQTYADYPVEDRYQYPSGGIRQSRPHFTVTVPGELTEKLDPGFYDLDCSATWTDGGIVTGHTGFWVCNRDTPFTRALWARDHAEAERLPSKKLDWYLKAIEEDPETPGTYEEAAEVADMDLKRYDLAADLLERYLEKLRAKVEQVAPGYEPRPAMGKFYPAFDPKARLAEVEREVQGRIARLRGGKGW
ncbi:MAG: hypothetical protein HYV63_11795 [Candidatus Schekmanbacteria bacterium]|nr:hypothetical protein [Candidatus Schekmanbacteria bacterium]